ILPMPAIERFHCERGEINVIETPHVDVDFVRIGPWHVKRMDPTHLAESVLRNLGVVLIGGKAVTAAYELELLWRHDQVEKPFLRADRAVAVGDTVEIGRHTETNAAAVAAALIRGRHLLILFEQTELARIARGRGQPKMLEREAGEQPSTRRALKEAFLDQ